VDLEHALGEIKTNCGNLHAGGSSLVASSNDDHARHSMPFRRGRPPHQLHAAGFAPIWQGTNLAAPELAQVRDALDLMLVAVSKLRQWVLKSATSRESKRSPISGAFDVDPRDPGRA
jgi:hypothetical protein